MRHFIRVKSFTDAGILCYPDAGSRELRRLSSLNVGTLLHLRHNTSCSTLAPSVCNIGR